MPVATSARWFVLLILAVGGGAAAAQSDPCPEALADAERRYQEQDYAAVEPAVSACIYSDDAEPDEVQEGYRLLALSLLRQGQLPEARLTVVNLLGVNYDYEPDVVYDPPSYVSLVTAVKEQLRVEAGRGGAVVDLNAAPEDEIAPLAGVGPALARRIVSFRDAMGPFDDLAALVVVEGVTPRLVERLARVAVVRPVDVGR
ncbi:helix-hairpin-helix domain-containing protein [Rubrivirga sp. S365]|uniref:Helix-hairpin-helix domain-containing protein n=1 Tax=Rubrivirga litoralis TaxID=3075598 RepID=A0ABU3BQE0_9BACT|nr:MULTISPECIES: helix-hairpin-helix domain-containing protein [unclassified Rubrivirga]MDT0631488.1 helix-hairpin-helix domain-containing protein [Rubrivirga sp. F394]MDT7855529.1 helix-hairpin-helix domain-containing protein [Rubrivirga sp. S365]